MVTGVPVLLDGEGRHRHRAVMDRQAAGTRGCERLADVPWHGRDQVGRRHDGLKTRSDMRFMPGMSLGWEWSFVAPIKLGDTVRVKFHVGTKRESKSKPGWGILVLPSELINQQGEVVQKGEHRVMVPRKPA